MTIKKKAANKLPFLLLSNSHVTNVKIVLRVGDLPRVFAESVIKIIFAL